ncbi:MAG: phosphoglucomutase/phosphomannomutase family protein [Dehalococcoidia bacterium]|nr:phosphoglucomutase/phosphomannomutase family protein [Dehalococcoidia bacterium]MDZ4246594.1 phosphoglucomutase/phosphomannomutase family protein [Dehalococcoidia bacterium]
MADKIIFGTDGWRAIIADDFTFSNVRACTQSIANYLNRADLPAKSILIGYDTRFASEDFAACAAEVMAGNGIKVYLCSTASPTPVLSYGITALKTTGGIIITASHNPAKWSGMKFKTSDGTSAPQETTDQMEKEIPEILAAGAVRVSPISQAVKSGAVEYVDLAPVYAGHIGKLVDLEAIKKARLKVAVDYMFGASAGSFSSFLGGGAIELIEINNHRNPAFPGMAQPEPIAKNLAALRKAVVESKASVGIATDGDGDRLGVIDENGEFLTTLQVYALLALYFLDALKKRGAIVKTLTSTSMLDRLGELYSVPVLETPVGFKYIAPLMISENALIGGEESGGYGFRGHVPERDGTLAGIYFLDFMVKTKKSPSELLKFLYDKVGPHHYIRSDVSFTPGERDKIINKVSSEHPLSIDGKKVEKTDTRDGFKFILSGGSWLLIRFSGTEPLLRIYSEAGSPGDAENLVAAGKKIAGV